MCVCEFGKVIVEEGIAEQRQGMGGKWASSVVLCVSDIKHMREFGRKLEKVN